MPAWRLQRQSELLATINRPRTAHSSFATGRSSPAPGSLSDLRNSGYSGLGIGFISRPSTASPGPGDLRPGFTLQASRSEANLNLSLGAGLESSLRARNLSSTSLATPSARRFESSSIEDPGSRPGSSHSMRKLADRPPPSLTLNLGTTTTAAFEPPQRSPLGHFELQSPVKSDTESLLGDDPDKIADAIEARIAREDEEQRRVAQGDIAAQRRRLAETAATPRIAYPSPPASIEGEQRKARSSPRPPAPYQDMRPVSRGNGSPMTKPTGHAVPAPRLQASSSSLRDDRPVSRGGRPPVGAGPLSSHKVTAQNVMASGTSESPRKERGNYDTNPTISGTQQQQQLLIPQAPSPRETTQDVTIPAGPAVSKSSRSPLLQQLSPFDVHSEEEDKPVNAIPDHRAPSANKIPDTTYGLPSPPLSHRTLPSGGDEGPPVLRTVEAKRDTILVGGPGRESLGLQIEQFEKSLQQAQAMSALENKVDPPPPPPPPPSSSQPSGLGLHTGTRSRANSNASSNYSDMSESPMTIEPPLVSPKPFPLSPRPMKPADRPPTAAAEAALPGPGGRPTLEIETRSESPFADVRQRTADIQTMRRGASSEHNSMAQPESPAAAAERPLWPRVGGGADAPRRPMLGEYGTVKVNTVASLAAGRVRRPSPDEYGIQAKQLGGMRKHTPPPPSRTASPFRMDAPLDVESPVMRTVMSFERMNATTTMTTTTTTAPSPSLSDIPSSEGDTDSADTSRANSPVSSYTGSGSGSGSYSVFSPPQQAPATRRLVLLPPSQAAGAGGGSARSAGKPEWHFGPAPTAPPTSPLPIPERSALRRKDTFDLAGVARPSPRDRQQQQQHLHEPPLPPPRAATAPLPLRPPPVSPGLAASASIVPNPDANPNWPLPGPASFASSTTSSSFSMPDPHGDEEGDERAGAGFAARRSVLRDRRPAPAPLNIAATRYADEISSFGGAGGPWTPDVAVPEGGPGRGQARGGAKEATVAPAAIAGFDFLDGTVRHGKEPAAPAPLLLDESEDKSSAIGVARGLSIKYDRNRARGEAEKRARTHEKNRLRLGAIAGGRLEEEEEEDEDIKEQRHVPTSMMPASPTTGEPFDRLMRPNHGLRSPTGIADEQGIRFI